MSEQPSEMPAPRGYVADAVYESTFFRELSPVWLSYVAAVNGVAAPAFDAPFRYLELGCGFGRSTTVHAAALPAGYFLGCDASPEHIAGAREHAERLGVRNVEFRAITFEAMGHEDLEPFDFIVLHGVYSWVDEQARAAVRALLERLLRPGGIAYVSYNCQPGWASEVPLRRLLVELAASGAGDSAARAAHAAGALEALGEGKLRYFATHPAAATAVTAYRAAPPAYLAHEFLNAAWEPHFSIDVHAQMREIGLDYVGSATLADNHLALLVDESAAQAIARLATDRERTLALDFAVDRRFRRDVFARAREDSRASTPSARAAAAAELAGRIVLGPARGAVEVPALVKVPRGELRLSEAFVRALSEALREGPLTLAAAVTALSSGRGNEAEVARNLLYLAAGGALQPYARTQPWRRVVPSRYASAVIERAIGASIAERGGCVLPSELLGNGLELERLEALGVHEYVAGAKTAAALAARLREHDERVVDAQAVAAHVIGDVIPSLVRLGLLE